MKMRGKKNQNRTHLPPEDWSNGVPESLPEEDLDETYGRYRDKDGVPFRGVNPKPKYYVVPKEEPQEAIKVKVKVRAKAKPKKVKVKVKRKA